MDWIVCFFGIYIFTLSVCACVRPSVTFGFFNILKSHCWIFIKPCKHVHICKTNTLDKKVRARVYIYIYLSSGACEQQRCRPACASAQTDQRLCYSLWRNYDILTCYERGFDILVSLSSWWDWFGSRFVKLVSTRPICFRDSEQQGADGTAHFCACVVRIQQSRIFSWKGQ